MDNTARTAKTPLWMRITLFCSLALNLLVAGVVVGAMVFGGPSRHSDMPRPDSASIFTRALDPEDRKAVRDQFVSHMHRQGRDRGAIFSGIQTGLASLRTTPFDEAAFLAAMADHTDRRAKRDAFGRQVLAAHIAKMTEQDRLAYADRVEQQLNKWTKRIRD
ncbi:periplasmic heavy metal sensor [Marivita sp. S0852]|uniref:periplasmic heavy metal sensor n=1 Tax=Marivita sp. S0852 TaxID=3373893 RepID=UPI003982CFCE